MLVRRHTFPENAEPRIRSRIGQIAKHLVEAEGGTIGVDARSPHGSIFWFTLRLCDASDPAETDDEQAPPARVFAPPEN